ncbi:MAG: adenylate/guanylate cyclase domain-containing protein, partial [Alphaproteobacteria bacterium]|nr:adenylate/guanylate cyclase domain-containing protein [Alphaproteobacteria bacterium]
SRDRVRRRLAAILVAGYSRPSSGDEADSFAGLRAVLTEIIEPVVQEFGGDVVNSTGERALTEFGSVVEAARCAVALRDAVMARNTSLAPEQRVALRIGVNLGDIIAEAGDIFGDGVNIAARIEALADPGTICVSGIVHDQIVGKVDLDFADLGPQDLKNINRPIRVFRMGGDATETLAGEKAGPDGPPKFDERRAIAVLPFDNFSHDPEQEFFADGITEDIISLLAGWRAFPVIARNSTFTYKGQHVDVKKVGEELGVRYVLEGSVRKSGHRVRVTAQLIQADTGHHIMAERYDRDLTDLFDLQDEIVATIAGAIEPELLKFERDRIAEHPQHNEDAYDFYQRGLWHHYRQNKADNIEAQAHFRRALAIDAQYPQATAALSIAVCNAAYLGWSENPERNYAEADELAQRATSLDPRFPNAHFALGLVCMWTKRSDRALAAFNEAINLNPSFAAAYVLLGQMHLYRGDPEEALSLAEKGIRLSPTDPRMFIWLTALAGAQYQMRHYEAAIEPGRRSWTLNRNWPGGLRYVVAGLAELGRMDEAAAALAELRKLNANLAFVEGNLKRLFSDDAAVDHILDGLRKAGFA